MTTIEAIAHLESLRRGEQWVYDNMIDSPTIREKAKNNVDSLDKGIAAIKLLDSRKCKC